VRGGTIETNSRLTRRRNVEEFINSSSATAMCTGLLQPVVHHLSELVVVLRKQTTRGQSGRAMSESNPQDGHDAVCAAARRRDGAAFTLQ
jgi:hypothetical protein